MIKIKSVKLNHEKELIGVKKHPRISWILNSDRRGCNQKKYWIEVSAVRQFDSVLYSSGWIESENSFENNLSKSDFVLESGKRYFIRVKVISNFCEESSWSKAVSFVTGIINTKELTGKFVSSESNIDKESSKATILRGTFKIDKEIEEAYAYFTSQGLYKAYLNGVKIGSDELTPGWTSYNKRLLYQTYDVKSMLKEGENVLGSIVGAGWYKGKMGFLEQRNNYGTHTSFFAELIIRFTDGTLMTWGSSKEFLYCDSPILFSEIYDGEIYDARLEREEWLINKPAIYYEDWKNVEEIEVPNDLLVPQPANRVCVNEKIKVQQLIKTPQNDMVLDFGQNLTGWVEFSINAPAGSKVVLECFEVLDKNGNVYFDNLRTAQQRITYICKGKGQEFYHPSFTFQGFRFVKITEYPVDIDINNFSASVIHSKMEFTGQFESSNYLLNRLHENIKWSLKGNFVDVPTDCPQRNERMGWTGDAQIFCQTANFMTNSYGFFSKWLDDVRADQLPEGGVPHVVPDIITDHPKVIDDWLLSQGTHSAAAWADVIVIAPWTLYKNFADRRILEENFESMKKWVDFMKNNSNEYIWNYKLQFGDWVALDAEPDSYFGATPNDLTCTAYFAYSTNIFAKICSILGKDDMSKDYKILYQNISKKYQDSFFEKTGDLKIKTQTAHIISLYFDLVPVKWKKSVTEGLIKLLKEHDGHLVTGFVGTPYFCHALSENGHVDEAYDLLLKEDFPSWLYQIKLGATTIWEHWDGIKEDGSMWSPDMNSFNHYAYGAIGEWIYRKILGIEVDEQFPGYKQTKIKPLVNRHLDYARGIFDSVHGKIEVLWEFIDNKEMVRLKVSIPPNTSATIFLENCIEIITDDEVEFKNIGNNFNGEILSGTYEFIYKYK